MGKLYSSKFYYEKSNCIHRLYQLYSTVFKLYSTVFNCIQLYQLYSNCIKLYSWVNCIHRNFITKNQTVFIEILLVKIICWLNLGRQNNFLCSKNAPSLASYQFYVPNLFISHILSPHQWTKRLKPKPKPKLKLKYSKSQCLY